MSIQPRTDFIIVDDDDISNVITRMTLDLTLGNACRVNTFINPLHALSFLKDYKVDPGRKAILFLDISMPLLSGWDFIKHFDKLPAAVREHIEIYILTSSLDPRDRERSQALNYVVDYFTKPLKPETVQQITGISPS